MEQDELKQVCAEAALDHILPKLNPDSILGIGTGSTTNKFIAINLLVVEPVPIPNIESGLSFGRI